MAAFRHCQDMENRMHRNFVRSFTAAFVLIFGRETHGMTMEQCAEVNTQCTRTRSGLET
jgi:hypothetical protein